MRYAIRNSIILFFILILIGAGGWAYLHYTQEQEIVQWQQKLRSTQSELDDLNSLIDQYNPVSEQLTEALTEYRQYPKSLFPEESQSNMYGFINSVNTRRSYIDYDLTYLDTELHDNYGIVRTGLSGSGYYRNLYRLIYALEHSTPLNKITMLHIETIDEPDQLGKVNIQMELESYFRRHSRDVKPRSSRWVEASLVNTFSSPGDEEPLEIFLKKGDLLERLDEQDDWTKVRFGDLHAWVPSEMLTTDANDVVYQEERTSARNLHNAFYPLIHSIPKNDGQVDIERSKLIALSVDTAYLIDQSGNLVNLSVGDEVYLGWLRAIDQKHQVARFTLNQGGIIRKIELKVDDPPLASQKN